MKKTIFEDELNYKRRVSGIFRNRNRIVLDVIIIMLSYFVMTLLIHNIYDTTEIFIHNILAVGFTVAMFVGTLFIFNMYRIMCVFAGTKDYVKLCIACLCASCPSIAFNILFYRSTFYFKLSFLVAALASMLIIVLRREGIGHAI